MAKKEQLCWTCQNATGGCSWTAAVDNKIQYEPVIGWDAKKVKRKYNAQTTAGYEYFAETYEISECPEYVEDLPR